MDFYRNYDLFVALLIKLHACQNAWIQGDKNQAELTSTAETFFLLPFYKFR